ncbi:MAG: hypothetical protein H8Z69_02930 [Nanohaloarchaea archaeon]|nr:hypothetical protein [Candidatus Nanohaloarchaea archaeon]
MSTASKNNSSSNLDRSVEATEAEIETVEEMRETLSEMEKESERFRSDIMEILKYVVEAERELKDVKSKEAAAKRTGNPRQLAQAVREEHRTIEELSHVKEGMSDLAEKIKIQRGLLEEALDLDAEAVEEGELAHEIDEEELEEIRESLET